MPPLETDKLNQQLTLRTGRRLGFAEYGDPGGAPVFYFHGWPGSRLEPRLADPLAAEMAVRIIGTDRPGYGLSDFQPQRTIGDWPADIGALADHLRLERFAVMGVSGGGPYAAACAARMPGRVAAAAMVCSIGPLDTPEGTREMVGLNRWLLFVARTAPWLARTLGGLGLRAYWHYDREVLPDAILARLPLADKVLLERPEVRTALLDNWREAFRNGTRGNLWDGCLYGRPWGFRLQDIPVPVHVWHGEADVIVPPAMGRRCAALLSRCHARFLPAEGHFSLPLHHLGEILAALTGERGQGAAAGQL